MSNPGNPFTAEIVRRGLDVDNPPENIDWVSAILVVVEGLWNALDELPGKPEATLAKRRLEEAMFWATRAGAPAEG